jgi:cytochrome c
MGPLKMHSSLKPLVPMIALATCVAALAQSPTYNLGRTPSAEESRTCCIPITIEGEGLPPGSGTAKQGAPIYAQKCAVCHGQTGTEGPRTVLVAEGTKALRGRFFATTIWDYIQRGMPPTKRTDWREGEWLNADEVYALTAFLLYRNRIIQESDVLDAQSLPKVQMPNRGAYTPPKAE